MKITVIVSAFFCAISVAQAAEQCGPKSINSGEPFKVNGQNVVLRSAPSANSEKLINQKATQALSATQYLTIDNTVTVIKECSQGDWSRVNVSEPTWLQSSHIGWVLTKNLRSPENGSSGKSEFTVADFGWDKNTSPYKSIIVAGVNWLHRENPLCKTIDPGSVDVSLNKGSKQDPVFYVTCRSGKDVSNVFFSKSEIEASRHSK